MRDEVQFKDQVPNDWLIQRLFATANKEGIYDNKDVYGQGLMDLNAAFTPTGEFAIIFDFVSQGGTSLSNTVFDASRILTPAFAESLTGRDMVVFDSMGAPYWLDMSSLISNTLTTPTNYRVDSDSTFHWDEDEKAQLSAYQTANSREALKPQQWQFDLIGTTTKLNNSVLNLANGALGLSYGIKNGLQATVFTTDGQAKLTNPHTGGILTWRMKNKPFKIRLGWLGERSSLLDSVSSGQFGALSSNSYIAGVQTHARAGGWHITADVEAGYVKPDIQQGLLTDLSGMTTSAFSFLAQRRLSEKDTLAVSLSQKPRLEKGRAQFRVPVSRTKAGAVNFEQFSTDLEPSGRQIDAAVRWTHKKKHGSTFHTTLAVSQDPGNVVSKPRFGLQASWQKLF